MKRAALILAALAAILTAAAAPVRTATEGFVANKIAEAVAPLASTNAVAAAAQAATNYTDAVAADYLPLTGGTLDGMLNAKGIVVIQKDSSGSPRVYLSMNTNCFVSLITDENGQTWRGLFYLPTARLAGMNINDTEALANLADIAAATNAAVRAANNYTDEVANDVAAAVAAIPDWAKAQTKPTYTASEVGAYSTGEVDNILQGYLPLDYFQNGQTIPMYWGDGTKLCDFGANWLGNLAAGVQNNSDAIDAISDDIPPAVSNIVTTALVRERLGVYLYVGADGGIYVHTNED